MFYTPEVVLLTSEPQTVTLKCPSNEDGLGYLQEGRLTSIL